MSTHYIYHTGLNVIPEENKLELLSVGKDNNVVSCDGYGRSSSRYCNDKRNLEVFRTLPLDDCEGIADYLEGLAFEYDGGMSKERGKKLDGVTAYHRWAGRIKKAGGPQLRAPRLSEIYYHGLPNGFFFGNGDSGEGGAISLKIGDSLDPEIAKKILKSGVMLKVKGCGLGWGGKMETCTVRYYSEEREAFFVTRPRKRRYGYYVDSLTISQFTVAEPVGNPAKYPWGPPLQYEDGDFVVTNGCQQFICSYYGSLNVMVISDKPGKYSNSIEEAKHKTFSEECAQAMVARLREYVPEHNWEVLPYDHYRLVRGLTS